MPLGEKDSFISYRTPLISSACLTELTGTSGVMLKTIAGDTLTLFLTVKCVLGCVGFFW